MTTEHKPHSRLPITSLAEAQGYIEHLEEQLEAHRAVLLRIEQLAWDELKGEIRSATIHAAAREVLYPASRRETSLTNREESP